MPNLEPNSSLLSTTDITRQGPIPASSCSSKAKGKGSSKDGGQGSSKDDGKGSGKYGGKGSGKGSSKDGGKGSGKDGGTIYMRNIIAKAKNILAQQGSGEDGGKGLVTMAAHHRWLHNSADWPQDIFQRLHAAAIAVQQAEAEAEAASSQADSSKGNGKGCGSEEYQPDSEQGRWLREQAKAQRISKIKGSAGRATDAWDRATNQGNDAWWLSEWCFVFANPCLYFFYIYILPVRLST